MIITPNTHIKLLKCPIKLDNKNQITFNSKELQYSYFSQLPYLEVDASMYQRANSAIYYPDLYDNLIQYNYVMYQNTNYSNKWYYAFVTGMKYINDNMTEIFIVEDTYQTWCFDVEWKASFVEREMLSVSSDVPRCELSA